MVTVCSEPTNATKLSVIIVNWNTSDLLQKCLSSLACQIFDPWRKEVLVVDNDSSDDSKEMVVREFPDVRLIRNERNLGFSVANNRGIETAVGEYLLLLNPDTVLKEQTLLRAWILFMEDHQEAGASGCKLVFPDGRYQYGGAGYRPTFSSLLGYASFLSKIFPALFKGVYQNLGSYRNPVEVDWVCGAALLVRAGLVPAVGKLDESIFMFGEDIEWCCRIRDAGHRVYYLPSLTIIHHQGAGVKRQRDQKSFSILWLRYLRSLYKQYNPRQPLLVFDFIMLGGFLLRTILYLFLYLYKQDPIALEKSRQMYNFACSIPSQLWSSGTGGSGRHP